MTTESRSDWPSGETGRYLVTLKAGSPLARAKLFEQLAGAPVVSAIDSVTGPEFLTVPDAESTYYPNVGVAVVSASALKLRSIKWMSGAGNLFESVEPERYGHVLQTPGSISYADDQTSSWGVKAVRADNSQATGRGVRIAVLDSGLDLRHPEFSHNLKTSNFVERLKPCQDVFGHGTHTAGTLCGSRGPTSYGRGFGIAPGVNLIVGKVLNDQGWYRDEWVIAGMDWAIANGAHVISMSLGANLGSYISDAYEAAGQRALAAGSLVIAAAGNSNGALLPVFSPANCRSIMAVGAVDHRLQVASFSAVGTYPPAGAVDLVAPGVDVHSTLPGVGGRGLLSGTSMAAPHVAGCAALWAESSGARGQALWDKLITSARKLGGPVNREGAGLVQAP